MMSLSCVN